MRRCVTAAVVLAIAALLVGTAAGATFTDATGDVVLTPPGGAATGLDVASVDVSNTSDGRVTFRIALAGNPVLDAPASIVEVVLDADKNTGTGGEAGLDAAFGYGADDSGSVAILVRWDEAVGDFVEVPASTLTGSYENGVVELTVSRADLMNTRGFAFAVLSIDAGADESIAIDFVPDSGELVTYDLVGIPPPPPPKLEASKPRGVPARPVHGKRFVISSLVTNADTGRLLDSGSTRCLVRIGDRAIRAAGRFRNPNAQCVMTVPRDATGKTLRGTMTVRAEGGTVKRTFSFRVR